MRRIASICTYAPNIALCAFYIFYLIFKLILKAIKKILMWRRRRVVLRLFLYNLLKKIEIVEFNGAPFHIKYPAGCTIVQGAK